MRQRIFVFVIVTLLAAICIAALQGCHRFSGSLGPVHPTGPSSSQAVPSSA